MGSVNKEKIISLAAEVDKAIRELSRYLDGSPGEILKSSEKLGNIKYQFVVAIEACVDMCQHLSARLFGSIPESYSQCFEVLAEHGVMNNELASQMSEVARFRNLLVHLYWKVDDRRVIEMLSRTNTFTQYVKAVLKFIEVAG